MKCAKYGTLSFSSSNTASVDISDLNLNSADEYMVLVSDGQQYVNAKYSDSTNAAYISAKSKTSFTVTCGGNTYGRTGIVSYQVITFD